MPRRQNPDAPYWERMRACERKIIEDELTRTSGNLAQAARSLGIHADHLAKRAAALSIDVPAFRARAQPHERPSPSSVHWLFDRNDRHE